MILKVCVHDAEVREGRVAGKIPKSPAQRKRLLLVAELVR